MNYIWVVEARQGFGDWRPMACLSYATRAAARREAKSRYLANQYNQAYLHAKGSFRPPEPAVIYRAQKYVSA